MKCRVKTQIDERYFYFALFEENTNHAKNKIFKINGLQILSGKNTTLQVYFNNFANPVIARATSSSSTS